MAASSRDDNPSTDVWSKPHTAPRTWLIAALSLTAVLLFSLGCYAAFAKLQEDHRAKRQQEAEHLLLSFEASATRLFDYADSYLRSLRAYRAEVHDDAKWRRFVQDAAAPGLTAFSGVVTVVDRDGWVTFQSETPEHKLKSYGSMADLDHFRHFREHPGDSLFIGATRLGRMTGKLQFRCARPLFKDGQFDGIVMLTLRPEHFTDLYRDMEFGPNSTLTVMTMEGKLIARHPAPSPEVYDRPLPDLKSRYGVDLARPHGRAYGIGSPFDGHVRDLSYRRLSAYPVTVLVGIAHEDLEAEMAPARKSLAALAAAFALAALVVAIMLSRIDRQNRALARSLAINQDAEEQLRIAAAAFDSQESMIITDRYGTILRVNQAFVDSTGYAPEEVVGQTPRILKSGRHTPAFYQEMWHSINTTGCWQGEIWDRRRDGEEYPKWLSISAVGNSNGEVTHYVGTHFDISERKAAEERIRQLAYFDQLTGLPNRTLLLDRLNQAIADSGRSGSHGALLFIDLDNFKTINDALGHDKGDLLLSQVASRLKSCIREGDTAARLGGDEFVVMLKNLGDRLEAAATLADALSAKIQGVLGQPYMLGEQEHHCTASIGVTLFSRANKTRDDLLKQADLAMYQAKAAGRNALRFFDPEMQIGITRRIELERELRIALRDGQLCLHFQPQVDSDGRCTGAEALVRWQHPVRGLVYPNDFIPIAEDAGLILPLGLWVLEDACRQLRRWADDEALRHLTLSVNVSGRQLHQPDFVACVLDIVARSGAPAETLKLELTESHLVNEVEKCITKMATLSSHGVQFALDDFGTGYSSLSYLKRLPLEKLKIDRSFVQDVLDDPNDAAIVRTIIALAQSLGLSVLAEGVETPAQRDFLAGSGCHWYQGYLFGRPVPLEAFEAFVRSTGKNA